MLKIGISTGEDGFILINLHNTADCNANAVDGVENEKGLQQRCYWRLSFYPEGLLLFGLFPHKEF